MPLMVLTHGGFCNVQQTVHSTGLILISLTIVTGCSSGGGSTSNDLDLDTLVSTNGNGFVAIARGKIFSGKGSIHIDTSSATGDGGNVILDRRGSKRQSGAIDSHHRAFRLWR